jgi:PAS domain S-box-containing protein
VGTIQLLVAADRDRDLLAETLRGDHTVRESLDEPVGDAFLDAEFDLCIVDWPAFRDYRDALSERAERAAPVFLPYLLVAGERGTPRATADVWDIVDEVIDVPVARAELTTRVENLLSRRELSVELNRSREFNERRFRSLFESTPDPIVVTAADGTVTAVNDAFVDTFDLDRAALLDRRLDEIDAAPIEPVERVLLRVDDPDPGDRTVEFETEGASSDRFVTELNVGVIEQFVETTERIGIFRDVTARERHRRELERKIDQLERFASVVSHDLRNPLNVAQAKVELAKRDGDHDEAVFDELESVHDRMEQLIEDVLALATQGELVDETEAVDLGGAVRAAWAGVATAPDDDLVTEGALGVVEADPERLRALLENLFRNAADHAGPGVTVWVGSLPDRPGFYVADDGPGVPGDGTVDRGGNGEGVGDGDGTGAHDGDEADVFAYGTSNEGGTGLGLAIVDQVASAHGWDVEVVESRDGGARFEIEGADAP